MYPMHPRHPLSRKTSISSSCLPSSITPASLRVYPGRVPPPEPNRARLTDRSSGGALDPEQAPAVGNVRAEVAGRSVATMAQAALNRRLRCPTVALVVVAPATKRQL
jgi:hypothetical protein